VRCCKKSSRSLSHLLMSSCLYSVTFLFFERFVLLFQFNAFLQLGLCTVVRATNQVSGERKNWGCEFIVIEQRRHASIICVACSPSVGSSSVATSRHGSCQPSSCRDWITAMPSLQAFRLQRWLRSRECCMPQLVWCSISSHAITCLRL